jgi:hypothetical protein
MIAVLELWSIWTVWAFGDEMLAEPLVTTPWYGMLGPSPPAASAVEAPASPQPTASAVKAVSRTGRVFERFGRRSKLEAIVTSLC